MSQQLETPRKTDRSHLSLEEAAQRVRASTLQSQQRVEEKAKARKVREQAQRGTLLGKILANLAT